jgi:hypothetical protein
MKGNKNLSAFEGGRLARKTDLPITDNPHPKGTQRWKWWKSGWEVIDKRIKSRRG